MQWRDLTLTAPTLLSPETVSPTWSSSLVAPLLAEDGEPLQDEEGHVIYGS
jgi:hypothetical protein